MGSLADCLKLHPGIGEIEMQDMLDRFKKRSKKGESTIEASRNVLKEYQADIDKDMDALRKGVKVKGPTKKERDTARQAVIDKDIKAIEDKFARDLKSIEDKITETLPKAKKGDTVQFTLAGRTITETDFRVQPNGDIIVDHFGQKVIKRGDYTIIPPARLVRKSTPPVVRQGKANIKKGDRIAPRGITRTDKKGKLIRPKPIIEIFADLQKNLNKLTKSIGTLKYTKKPAPGAIGAFSPFYRTIAMKSVGDLDTTSHELAHAMDEAYGLKNKIPDNMYGDIHKELVPYFSNHGSPAPPNHPNPESYELGEGIAEWTRAYLINPDEAIENAPTFHSWYKSTLPQEAHDVMNLFAEDMRILVGASEFDIVNASWNIVPEKTLAERTKNTKDELLEALKPHSRNPNDFKVTWLDKLKQKFTNSMHPWDATITFAASVGNIDLNKVLPSWNPLIMARLFLGRNSKVQNFIETGFVNFNSDERVVDKKTDEVVNLEWALSPYDNTDRATFDEELNMMINYGLGLRTQEMPLKFVEKQIYAALEKNQIIPSQVLYSNKRFYDKFNDWNESIRESIYSANKAWNENLKDQAVKEEGKINKKYNAEKAKLEGIRRKQQLEIDSQRQKYYDQKGEIPEKKRLEELRRFEQESREAQEAFKKAIDGIEIEQFKAHQRLQARIDDAMNKVLKETVLARIKSARGQRFTPIGGNLIPEQQVAQGLIKKVEQLPKEKRERIKEGLRRYRVIADTSLQYLLASGRISPEAYKKIKADNLEYIMMSRLKEAKPGEPLENIMPVSSKGISTVKEVLHGIKGSTAVIKDPYNSLLQFVHRSVIEADRNFVLKSYVDFMRIAIKGAGPDAGRISNIINPTVAGDENAIKVFIGGEARFYQVDSYIYQSMKGIVDQLYTLPPWVRFMPQLLRASVTNNPVFAARNLLRDYQTMLVVSDNVSNIKDVVPRKLQKIGDLKPKDAYDVFGAGQGGYQLLNEKFYNQTMEDTAAKLAGTKGNILVKAADFAQLAGRSFGHLSGASEKVTRMQEFKNSFRKSKKKGMDDYNAGLKAAFDARSLMDFAVIGEWMNVINQLIPFTNAKIQGLRVAKRGFLRHPLMFSMKAGLTIMLPQFLMRAMMDREDDDRYQQLPEYQRNMFWNIPTGTGWLMIPKPHDIAVISTMADMSYDHAMGNKVNYTGFNQAIFALLPLTRADLAGPLRTFVEMAANKDFFRERDIVPPWQEKQDLRLLEKENKYQMSSRIGKFIGEPIGVDPRKIDHFLRGTFAYFGNQTMRLSDIGREDKKRSLADMTGFYKNEPVYSYQDVQWAQEQAERYNLETEEYYMVLRWMLQEYSHLEDDLSKKQMSIAIREYSGYVKDLWESYGIHEEAVGEYREEFKDAIRKQSASLMKSQFVKDLKRSKKERKEFMGP